MITKEQIEQLGNLIYNINPDKHYWFFRTMGGTYYDEYVSRGYIAFGYDGITMKDLKNIPERDDMARAYLKIRLQELNKEMTDSHTAKAAGQIVRFYRGLAVGDVVVAPSYQSKKFAIGIIESEMYEDSGKHAEGECQFIKRRKVRWEKEVWRSELDPKAILAFGNQQTMSSIDEYAEYIDRKICKLYSKGDKTYLVLSGQRLPDNQTVTDKQHLTTHFSPYHQGREVAMTPRPFHPSILRLPLPKLYIMSTLARRVAAKNITHDHRTTHTQKIRTRDHQSLHDTTAGGMAAGRGSIPGAHRRTASICRPPHANGTDSVFTLQCSLFPATAPPFPRHPVPPQERKTRRGAAQPVQQNRMAYPLQADASGTASRIHRRGTFTNPPAV